MPLFELHPARPVTAEQRSCRKLTCTATRATRMIALKILTRELQSPKTFSLIREDYQLHAAIPHSPQPHKILCAIIKTLCQPALGKNLIQSGFVSALLKE